MDVLDHDNRIIHQNADRKDQRKQRHPVEREAPGPGGKQCQQQGDHDGEPHDHRLAPTHADQHQQHHGQSGKDQLTDQRIGLIGRRDAVIPGHRHLDLGGQQAVFQHGDPLFDTLGHLDRVLPWLLADGEGHRG